MRKVTVFMSALLLVLALGACASKPEAEIAAATKAVEDARAAEADVYAATEFQAAADSLAAAEAEITAADEQFALTRSYEKATELLKKATTEAQAAASAAVTNKEVVKQEAEAALTDAQAAIQTAKDMLAKAPKGKGTKADLEAMQGDLAGIETACAQAEQTLSAGKYMDARDQLKNVISQAQSISSQVEAAIAARGRR